MIQLPLDVLTVVCYWLPSPSRQDDVGIQALSHCTQVNTLFREAAHVPSLWKYVYGLRYFEFDPAAETCRTQYYGDDWRLRYYARRTLDSEAYTAFLDVVYNLDRRPDASWVITKHQMDVYDFLCIIQEQPLPQYFQESAEPEIHPRPQSMTRRYWATQLLLQIPAMGAVQTWAKLHDDPLSVTFEDTFNALSGFFGVPTSKVRVSYLCVHYVFFC